jgi:serine/threonine protein phosphatase 1
MSYKRIEFDPTKRYLIIGDIHGQMESLRNLLQACGYDESKDILITTGDMIDRGPYSIQVIDYFDHPDRHSIMGNHELMALESETDPGLWMMNGGYETMADMKVNNISIDDLRSKIKDLPIVLEVGGEFRVVHADVPGVWDDQDIFDVANDDDESLQKHLLWSRETVSRGEQIGDAIRSMPTYCGHSRLPDMRTIGDITFIDREFMLMAVDHATGDTWEVKAPHC